MPDLDRVIGWAPTVECSFSSSNLTGKSRSESGHVSQFVYALLDGSIDDGDDDAADADDDDEGA